MKNKIIFLVCAVFLTIACEKEQHTGKESRVSVTVYDENGKAMPGIPVKMYDEKDYKAFEQDNLTPPTAGYPAQPPMRRVSPCSRCPAKYGSPDNRSAS